MFGAEKIMVLRILVINSSEMTPAAVPFTKGFSSYYFCQFPRIRKRTFCDTSVYYNTQNTEGVPN